MKLEAPWGKLENKEKMMIDNVDAVNFALALAHIWLGFMIFAHGWKHVKALKAGPGMAQWFESLGLRPGSLHALLVTLTELGVGVVLILGLLTPLAYGGLCALMLVAVITSDGKNGFFSGNQPPGWEYPGTIALLSIALGTLGPGKWSLDHVLKLDFPFDPHNALVITAALGILGAALFLIIFWRPTKKMS
mgnify:CR=1 FL=1